MLTPTHASPLTVLRRLDWRVRHPVANVLSGNYRSVFRGRGMEFDQVVKYAFGDDVRDLDWNVTARLGEPYRKTFVEEREITLLALVADTPGLQMGSGLHTKREALFELATLFMLLGAANRDRVGVVHATPTGHRFFAPVRGRHAVMHTAAALLATVAPALGRGEGAAIPWRLLRQAATRHSLLLWFGDFAPGPAPAAWAGLRRQYQTLGMRVEDPWERTLPRRGMTAYDPTTGRLVTLTGSAAEQRAHAAWGAARDATWRTLFPDALSRLTITPDEDRFKALVRFFHRRMEAM